MRPNFQKEKDTTFQHTTLLLKININFESKVYAPFFFDLCAPSRSARARARTRAGDKDADTRFRGGRRGAHARTRKANARMPATRRRAGRTRTYREPKKEGPSPPVQMATPSHVQMYTCGGVKRGETCTCQGVETYTCGTYASHHVQMCAEAHVHMYTSAHAHL